MGTDFKTAIRPAIVMTLLFALLLGFAYPLLILGVGQAVFPTQANGSLVRDGDKVVGSTVVGQAFTAPRYFQTRPSAAGTGYDGLNSSGSNLGPTSKALADRVRVDVAKRKAEGVTGPMPADLVTASGSGLDPDISPETAYVQIARVAKIRGVSETRLRLLVGGAVEQPLLGIVGEPHVNVFVLNRQLDRLGASSPK